jgi:ribonuclease HII
VHKAALQEWGPTPYHRLSWAYLDALPQWRHLKKARSWADASVPEVAGQLGFDF